MNRKKRSKVIEAEKRQINTVSPFDDPKEWVGCDFEQPPLDAQWQRDYQAKLDSAFGGKNAILLVWSGDRKYWSEEFYTDWTPTGLPKGKLEKKPIILFGSFPVNATDYLYVFAPRWLLVEVEHRAQYEGTWEDGAWVSDGRMIGGKKRVRSYDIPLVRYQWLRTIAEHDTPQLIGEKPLCCRKMHELPRVCYGRYRPPSDADLAFVRGIREQMDAKGIAQRNDAPVGDKMLNEAALATKFFYEQAAQQETMARHNFIMENPRAFLGSMPRKRGITLSAREIDEAVREGLAQSQQERFGKAKQKTI